MLGENDAKYNQTNLLELSKASFKHPKLPNSQEPLINTPVVGNTEDRCYFQGENSNSLISTVLPNDCSHGFDQTITTTFATSSKTLDGFNPNLNSDSQEEVKKSEAICEFDQPSNLQTEEVIDPNKQAFETTFDKFKQSAEMALLKSGEGCYCHPSVDSNNQRLIVFQMVSSQEPLSDKKESDQAEQKSVSSPENKVHSSSLISGLHQSSEKMNLAKDKLQEKEEKAKSPQKKTFNPELDKHIFVSCLNEFMDYINWGVYTRYGDLLRAVDSLFNAVIQRVAKTGFEKSYFGYLLSIFICSLQSEKTVVKYHSRQAVDMDQLVNHWKNWKIPIAMYPRVPRCSRSYIEIKSYEPAILCSSKSHESNPERIKEKMKCSLGGPCLPSCECNQPIDQQGEFSLKESTWISTCPNRKNRIECTDHDNCDNTRLSKKKHFELDKDLEITLCWGIDVYTRINLFSILGHYEEVEEKNKYINEKNEFIDAIIKVSNFCSFEGWNLRATCQKMREMISDKTMKTKLGLKDSFWIFCRIIEDLLLYKASRSGFRFFSKGVGVICKR